MHTGSKGGNIAIDDSDPDVGLVGNAGLRLVPKDLGGGGPEDFEHGSWGLLIIIRFQYTPKPYSNY